MKIKFFLSFVIFMLFLPIISNAKEKDFRKANWGMSKQEVIKMEGKKPDHTKNNAMAYRDTVAGFTCFAGYGFIENKLTRGFYSFIHEHSNSTDFIGDYEKLKELLTKKYGAPVEDEVWWKNDLYRSDPQHWGMAIEVGHLVYYAVWKTEDTEIELNLFGENFHTSLRIDYTAKQFENLEKGEREKKELDAL